jgi:hypothetical protein
MFPTSEPTSQTEPGAAPARPMTRRIRRAPILKAATEPQPPDSSPRIEGLSLSNLRAAIRANHVSFPSQVPTFPKHDRPDLQRKMVQLYFLFGWNCDAIGNRYGLIRQRVQQILNTWKRRAVQTGYIQHIPPLEKMARDQS